jgi:hypothetical protein
MYLDIANERVGINKSSPPAATLDVNGNAIISGTTNVSGTLSGATGSFSYLSASQQISAQGGIVIPGVTGLANYANYNTSNYTPNTLVPKQYVDLFVSGISIKEAVVAIQTGTPIGGTYVPTGVGSITGVSSSLTIDTIPILDGSAVLLNSQTDSSHNGVYVWTPATSTLTRRSGMQNGQSAKSAYVFVKQGINYAKTAWVQSSPDPSNQAIVGVNNLNFNEFSSFDYELGRGLSADNAGGLTTIDVDTSLNFINFLDSNTSSGGDGTLAIGTATTSGIILGPTGGIPIQAQSIIEAQQGITGGTGSFSYLSASQKISASSGITGGTGSFSYLSASQEILAPAGITGGTGSFRDFITTNVIKAQGGITGTTGSFSYLSAPLGITSGTGSFSYLSASQEILAPKGITGGTGSFSYLSATQEILAPKGITGGTGSFSYLSASQEILAPLGITGGTGSFKDFITTNVIKAQGGITGTTGSFSYLSASQKILAPAGITGGTGSFSYLSASQEILAPKGITGGTGSFSYLSASQEILAPLGITGGTGSFKDFITTNVIKAQGGITGTTGSFSYLSAPLGITSGTGSFSYLSASQKILAPAGITGGTGSFSYLSSSQEILAPLGITGGTGSFSYLSASQQILAPKGITGGTGSFSYLSATQEILAPLGITGGTGSFSYLSASQKISAPLGITGGTGSFSYLHVGNMDITGLTGPTGPIGPASSVTGPTGSGLWLNNTSNIYYNSGNVGIGTSIPSYTLDVSGNMHVTKLLISNGGITGATGSFSNLSTSGITKITNSTNSTAADNGALVVSGGVGIGGDIHCTGTITSANTSPNQEFHYDSFNNSTQEYSKTINLTGGFNTTNYAVFSSVYTSVPNGTSGGTFDKFRTSEYMHQIIIYDITVNSFSYAFYRDATGDNINVSVCFWVVYSSKYNYTK